MFCLRGLIEVFDALRNTNLHNLVVCIPARVAVAVVASGVVVVVGSRFAVVVGGVVVLLMLRAGGWESVCAGAPGGDGSAGVWVGEGADGGDWVHRDQ